MAGQYVHVPVGQWRAVFNGAGFYEINARSEITFERRHKKRPFVVVVYTALDARSLLPRPAGEDGVRVVVLREEVEPWRKAVSEYEAFKSFTYDGKRTGAWKAKGIKRTGDALLSRVLDRARDGYAWINTIPEQRCPMCGEACWPNSTRCMARCDRPMPRDPRSVFDIALGATRSVLQ